MQYTALYEPLELLPWNYCIPPSRETRLGPGPFVRLVELSPEVGIGFPRERIENHGACAWTSQTSFSDGQESQLPVLYHHLTPFGSLDKMFAFLTLDHGFLHGSRRLMENQGITSKEQLTGCMWIFYECRKVESQRVSVNCFWMNGQWWMDEYRSGVGLECLDCQSIYPADRGSNLDSFEQFVRFPPLGQKAGGLGLIVASCKRNGGSQWPLSLPAISSCFYPYAVFKRSLRKWEC